MDHRLQQLYEASTALLAKREKDKLELDKVSNLAKEEIINNALSSILEQVQQDSVAREFPETKRSYPFTVGTYDFKIPMGVIINSINRIRKTVNGMEFYFFDVSFDKKNALITGYISIEKDLPLSSFRSRPTITSGFIGPITSGAICNGVGTFTRTDESGTATTSYSFEPVKSSS